MKQEEKVPFAIWKQNLLKAAVDKWGSSPQIDMLVEECGELIVDLQHYKRGRVAWDKIAEELADVRIMMGQIELIANIGALVDAKENGKLKRLEQRLEESK